jgi:hypothetical protein
MTRILLDMGLCFFVLLRSKAADVKKNRQPLLGKSIHTEKGDDT